MDNFENYNEIGNIVFNEQTISRKVKELASRISDDYEGKEVVVISILKGAFVFTADLLRQITVPIRVEFMQAASYGALKTSSGEPDIKLDLFVDIHDKNVLLVDTIVDTGKTFNALLSLINKKGPATLRTAVLLDKFSRRICDVPVNYKGFEIPDIFVVGYGLDYKDNYRNLPHIVALR
jgi:hypoxanthine phosphoribosyltransferase